MKKLIYLVVITLFTTTLSAQEWKTSFETAKKEALAKKQNIVLVFQGSDWCAPCIKLDKEIWSTEEFKKRSKNYFVMLQADFPKRKSNKLSKELQDHNNKLAEKYNPNGIFPYVVVLDAQGKVLGTTSYEKTTPEKYYNKLVSFEK